MSKKNFWIATGGIMGFLGVALGAFGAHGLTYSISPDLIQIYKTGIQYHLIHSVAIIAVASLADNSYYKSALFFTIGIILFSFSLYLYALTQMQIFAMITPIGGVSFLIGWLLLIITAFRNSKGSAKI
jgi:uncharacterized membrane protein YgdD (TMEM256/DUF423 family)